MTKYVTVDGERHKCYCNPQRHRGYPLVCAWHMNPAERKIRMAMPDGMRDGIDVRIELHTGFEDWGTYETWGSGWIITGKGFKVADRDLNTAVDKFVKLIMDAREKENIEPWLSFKSPTLKIMLDKP